MRIFVGGSSRGVIDVEALHRFVAALGQAVVERGHVLLNGCRNPVDKEIAEAAERWLVDHKCDPKRYLISYWQRNVAPVHKCGTVRASALPDWKMSRAELRVPEQIDKADVTVFVAGGEGTYTARNWAYWARKPIVSVPRFGGAGERIYLQELRRLRDTSHDQCEDYEELNQVSGDVSEYAKELVLLSERLLIPRDVFPVMSFNEKLRDVYRSFEEICAANGFNATRIDESLSHERINPRIEKGIAKSAFVLADLTDAGSNVFFEVGFARGCGKPLLVTAEKGTELPFDLADLPVLFWESRDQLREGLNKRIAALKERLNPSGL